MQDRSSNDEPDINELAKGAVERATGQQPDPPKKNQAAVELGRRGGQKGGKARAKKLAPEKRREIARKAAKARWGEKADK